jgi:hypothetical protein
MSRYTTHSDPDRYGTECVVRVQASPALTGGTSCRRTQRKMMGKRKADALEYLYAGRMDRREERRVEQLLDRRAKRGR